MTAPKNVDNRCILQTPENMSYNKGTDKLLKSTIVFAAASLLKDTANRIGDLLDDGKPNQSFKS